MLEIRVVAALFEKLVQRCGQGGRRVKAVEMQPRTRRGGIGSGLISTAPARVGSELYVVCSRSIAGVM